MILSNKEDWAGYRMEWPIDKQNGPVSRSVCDVTTTRSFIAIKSYDSPLSSPLKEKHTVHWRVIESKTKQSQSDAKSVLLLQLRLHHLFQTGLVSVIIYNCLLTESKSMSVLMLLLHHLSQVGLVSIIHYSWFATKSDLVSAILLRLQLYHLFQTVGLWYYQ